MTELWEINRSNIETYKNQGVDERLFKKVECTVWKGFETEPHKVWGLAGLFCWLT